MRRVWVLLAVTLVNLIGSPATAVPASRPPVALRVMSFNIHTGIGADGVLDLARTADAIRDSGADVVALQEVDVHWAERSAFRDQATALATATRMRVFFAPIYDLDPLTPGAPRRRYGVAVLSDLPVRHTANLEITRLSTVEPNPVPRLMPGLAEVEVLVRGVPVRVYSTHLDYRPDPAVRAAQVADTLRLVPPRRAVLIGDFNAPPDAPELAPLFAALAPAPTGPTFPATAPDRRIDYVTASPDIRVRAARVPATVASDHRPVVADLLVR